MRLLPLRGEEAGVPDLNYSSRLCQSGSDLLRDAQPGGEQLSALVVGRPGRVIEEQRHPEFGVMLEHGRGEGLTDGPLILLERGDQRDDGLRVLPALLDERTERRGLVCLRPKQVAES